MSNSGHAIIESPADWASARYSDVDGWSETLGAEECEELGQAARQLPPAMQDWVSLTPADIPLARLAPRLQAINDDLERGRGFALLRGIDLPENDFDTVRRIKWVLALNLGDVIAQNAKGEMMGSVQAEFMGERTQDVRGYVSRDELRFHCDGGDVASLLCVRQAPTGGTSSLVSSVAIHNIMARECPEHLEVLYRGIPLYMRKESSGEGVLDSSTLPRIPLFRIDDGQLSCFSNLRLMELSYEAAGLEMPGDERAALAAFEAIAERETMKIEFKLRPGDLLLVHNLAVMHKRSAFEDDPDPAKARLMLRLWYNVRGGRTERIRTPEQRKGYFTKAPLIIQDDFQAEAARSSASRPGSA